MQWSERVDHDCKLVRFSGVDTLLDGTRVRSVRQAAGMKRKRSAFDPAPAHKIPLRIIKNFIAVDIAVIVWCGNGKRMIIEKSRHK